MNNAPCRYCGKLRPDHFTNATPYPLCKDILNPPGISSWQYIPMTNLEHLEWKYEQKFPM
jgi:hypothetical protein